MTTGILPLLDRRGGFGCPGRGSSNTSDELQPLHIRTARFAAATSLAGGLLITSTALIVSRSLRERLFNPAFLPLFVVLPLVGIALIVQLFRSLAMEQKVWPSIDTVLLFILSFTRLGMMVFQAVLLPSVTIFQASSSLSSMVFMRSFIGLLIPTMLFYNI